MGLADQHLAAAHDAMHFDTHALARPLAEHE
jgi:hypothetical protein